jgi:hypothetical protein
MNCHNFEKILHPLATGRSLDESQRMAALAHAENCTRCEEQLENERQLAGKLRVLAKENHGNHAPTHLEIELLEAFRKRDDTLKNGTGAGVHAYQSNASARGKLSTFQADHSHRLPWIMLVAASLLLLIGLGLMRWQGRVAKNELSQASKPLLSLPSSSSLGSLQQIPKKLQTTASTSAPGSTNKKSIHFSRTQGAVSLKHKENDLRSSPSTTQLEGIELNEIETGFLPMMAASPLEPTESGHLIRMKLPRSTLGRFGFPLNLGKAEEPVKADVLIGEDGVARAIRFVYTAE